MQFLLVEDDEDLRREVGEYLLRRHHGVIALATAAAARAFLERRPAALDAVLCDVNLPDGDGFELYAEHGAQSTAVRWVLLTGDPDERRLAEVRGANAGLPAAILVEKPASLRRVAALLERGTATI